MLPFLTVKAQRITGISFKLTHFLNFLYQGKTTQTLLSLTFPRTFFLLHLTFLTSDFFFYDSDSAFSLVSGTVLLPSTHKVVIVTHSHFQLLGKRCYSKCMFGMTFHLNRVNFILRSCLISDLLHFLLCCFSVAFCNTCPFSAISGFH